MLARLTRAALLVLFFAALSLNARAANNGTVNGSLTFSAGKFSNAASGFSDSNYIRTGSGLLNFGSSSSWTIEAWLKTTSSGTQVALSSGLSGDTQSIWFGVSGGKFTVSLSGTSGNFASGTSISSTITINDGSWHHCAVTVANGTNVYLFVDGALGATSTGTMGAPTNTDLNIGVLGGSSGFSWSGGSVDEVAVWSTAKYTATFTPSSVAYAGNESGLLALYHLNTDGTDSSGFTSGGASLPQSDNFDTDTTGAIAPGWYPVSGNWQVGTVAPVSGSHSFGDTANTDGDATLYSNMAAVADVQTYFEEQLTSDNYLHGSLLRMDAGYQNGYLVTAVFSGPNIQIQIWKLVGGTYTSLSTTSVPLTGTVGAVYAVRTQIQGSVITAKVWLKSAGEPGGWGATQTDTSVTAAGYVGLYNTDNVTKSVDNFTVSAPVATTVILPNNSAILYSPGNWDVTSARALSVNAGAYFSTMFSGGSISLNFDVSSLGSPASEIYYRIDGFEAGSPFTAASVAGTITPAIPSATSAASYHLLEVVIKSTSETINRWNSPSATAVSLTGIQVDAGATVLTPRKAPNGNVLFFGDSITEGVRTVNSTATNDTDRNDSMTGWAYAQRKLLGVEVGIIGFGGSGLTVTGSGNVPPLSSTYNNIMAGVARTAPQVKMIVLNEGTNDGGATASAVTTGLTTALNSLLSTYAGVPIVVLRPFNGAQASALQAGIAACSNPARVTWVDTTGFFNAAYGSSDGLHPGGVNNLGLIAPQVAAALSHILNPIGKSYTFN